MESKSPITSVHSVGWWLPQTETWLYTQINNLPPWVKTHVVCEYKTNLDQFPHPNLHCLRDRPRWRNFPDKLLRRLGVRDYLRYKLDLARRLGADVVHSHFGNIGWQDTDAVRKIGAKHVVTFYGVDVVYLPQSDPAWYDRYRKLFDQVDRVLCEGEHMAQCVVGLGCNKDKVMVHHLGIDTGRIPFEPRSWKQGDKLRVLMAGTFREKKGFPDALRALARIKDEVDLAITIIGDGGDKVVRTADEKKAILSVLRKEGLESATTLLGFQPYHVLLEEARRHHIFLSPSVTASDGDTEGGAPVTIIEMAAAGMAIVSTRHCDIPGVIIDGVTGLLAEERDVEGLAGCLRRLIARPESWQEMLVAGRRHIEREFDGVVQGERLGQIYRRLVSP